MADTDLLASGAAVNAANLNAATTSNSKTSATAAQTQLSSDINFFLKMLTTQLQNQDPTSPLDTNQFTQQIAQYSSVQQQVVTNSNLEKLLAANKQSSITTAVGYIGKEIETKGNTGEVSGGQGAFSYILPKAAANVTITIRNASGQTVFSGKGDNREGRNIAVWDGVNSTTGDQEPDGTYTISVEAEDAAKKPILAETRAVAIVGGVESDSNGDTLLAVGRNKVKFDEVIAVRSPSRIDLSQAG
jgi:flagellar basal-body rod modification protein FlgD